MDERIDLVLWSEDPDGEPWQSGQVHVLSARYAAAVDEIEVLIHRTDADWLLFWDPRLGRPDADTINDLASGRADVWHSGLSSGVGAEPEEYDFVNPIWPLALDASPEIDSSSWRLSLSAMLVKVDILRCLGSLDRAFHDPTGAGLELGRRFIDRGAVVINTPRLANGVALHAEPLSEHDRFVFLRRTFGRKWVRYAAARRAMAHRCPQEVVRAMRSSRVDCAANPPSEGSLVERPRVAIPDGASISVVLPTLGRYELLRPVLEQLRKQTIPARQVVVVDQNDPSARDHVLYEEFADLGLEVIFQEERGQWLARNAAVQRCTGEWIAFIDDDSEVGTDFLEQHLEGLLRYDADLSTGASLAAIGAPIPDNYAYFRVADQWDSGNGMCHRSLLERFGLFDQQFDRQRRGDAEFGLRVQLGGGLVIHNPHAIRVHLKAQEGGLRTFGSLDGFRHRDRKSPLPLPSMVYYTKRYHTPRQVREDLLIGLSQAIIPYELKRRATPRQWAGFLATELFHLPSTVRRVRSSLRIADRMVHEGPRIPTI